MTADTDDIDDLDLPEEGDIASTGAAADSVETDNELKQLPRILRYAMLTRSGGEHLRERLIAEIAEVSPDMPQTIAWAESHDPATGLALAVALDRLAVTQDKPDLRSLADSVRLLTLPLPGPRSHDAHHRRVAKSLLQAASRLPVDIDLKLAADVEAIGVGWAVLPAQAAPLARLRGGLAVFEAWQVGRQMAKRRVALAEAEARQEFNEELQTLKNEATGKIKKEQTDSAAKPAVEVPEDHVLVCSMADTDTKNPKMREIVTPLKSAINAALPLVHVPPLHQVRNQLLFEFPYAEAAIDFALADLVGRRTVRLRPLLLVGVPGGGKSRFVRRLGEILGVGVWRTDASRSDGAVFAGTDKRWYSAEPCHPFLAIVRHKHANVVVLLDELEKAGTRADYGRLWDCLLAFLEPETAQRFPDPALQTQIDVSHVSFLATANSLDPLPAPLRDRFRIVNFPEPGPEHLDALLAPIVADLAAESGLDSRWIEPLSGYEHDLIAAHWRGGSVRRLRRVVEVVLRARDKAAVRN